MDRGEADAQKEQRTLTCRNLPDLEGSVPNGYVESEQSQRTLSG